MKRLISKTLVFCLLCSFGGQPQSFAEQSLYVVQPGDTLSTIAFERLPGSVYARRGSLFQLMTANPTVKDPNRLMPGQEILLPETTAAVAAKVPASRAPATVSPIVEETAASDTSEAAEATAPAHARYSEIELDSEFSYKRVEGHLPSSASSASLVSTLNPGLALTWRQNWSPKLRTHLRVGAQKISFEGTRNKTLTGASQAYHQISAGAELSVAPALKLGATVATGEEIFYYARSASELVFNRVPVARTGLSLRYDLLQLAPYTLDVKADAAYLFSARTDDYAVNSGHAFRLGVNLREEHDGKPLTFRGGVFYGIKAQDSSILNKTETDLGLTLGLGWSFK